MIVPIFKTATTSVKHIERKLALYESSRNILDILECEIKLAVMNERGGMLGLKSAAYADNDPSTHAGLDDSGLFRYKQSRREADAFEFVKADPSGFSTAWKPHLMPFRGVKYFPGAYGSKDAQIPDAWKSTLRTSLLYQTIREWWSSDADFSDTTGERWHRGEQLNDVKTIEASFVFYNNTMPEWKYWNNGAGVGYVTRHYTAIPDYLQPGQEIRNPPYFSGTQGFKMMRRIQGIRVMDLDFAYWGYDQQASRWRWKEIQDNGVVYFWPAPPAIRVTTTTTDYDKRGMLTLCRVVHLPIGMHDGVLKDPDADQNDTEWTGVDAYDGPDTFNIVKNMGKVEKMYGQSWVYTGDETYVYSGDTAYTEKKSLKRYATPINWVDNAP